MSLERVYADPYTRAELGASGLVEVTRNLWPVNCQTCGGALGEDSPALVVFDRPEQVEASLHHSQCCPPQWTRLRQPFRPISPSHFGGLIAVATGEDGATVEPVLLVNPSRERVRIVQGEHGHWIAAGAYEWESRGLVRVEETGWFSSAAVADAHAWYTEGTLTIDLGEMTWVFRDLANESDKLHRALVELGRVTLGITTAIDPEQMGGQQALVRAISAADVFFGAVPLTLEEVPPEFTAGQGMPDDFDALFPPGREAIELPVTPWAGPSYDPATGTFQLGLGPDGPMRQALNTPGVGVHSGLLVGPPECGKTNALRITYIEALYADVFYPLLADPLARNGHGQAIGSKLPEEMFTDTWDGTVQFLEALAHMVDYRARTGGFTNPTKEAPGVLLFLEDADKVFTDARLADLAFHSVTVGESAGVGIIATAEKIDLECFSGRRDLILALGRKSLQAFSEKALAQFQVYRSRG